MLLLHHDGQQKGDHWTRRHLDKQYVPVTSGGLSPANSGILDLFEEWMAIEQGLSENTIRIYIRAARQFCVAMQADDVQIDHATSADVERFVQSLLDENRKASTVRQVIAGLRRLFLFRISMGYAEDNPATDVKHRPDSIWLPKVPLDKEQISRFLDSIPTDTNVGIRDKAIAETLYATGGRVGEVSHLRLEDVYLEESSLLFTVTKSQEHRYVPLTEVARDNLATYMMEGGSRDRLATMVHPRSEHKDRLWLTTQGGPMSADRMHLMFRERSLRAGIDPPVTPHQLRHALAVHLLESGVPVEVVGALLGHKQLNTTVQYTYVTADRLDETHLLSHPRR